MNKNTYKSGFVAIIGRPNVGKSTMLNQILGQKIVITTDKAQTTRKRIKGILTTNEGQIVFIDTPGVHKPLNKLGEFLLDEAKIAIPDADLILFLVDGSEPSGKGDKWIVENILNQSKTPVLLVLNKIDKTNPEKINANLETYKNLTIQPLSHSTIQLSAKTGKGKEKLIYEILNLLPEGQKLYDEDVVTEETMRDVASEIIREKILINTKEEIPHSVAVKIENYEEKPQIDRIFANIYCETPSQKGILIGKGGSLLKIIGTQARLELEQIVEKKVYLELNVKVEKDWRKKEQMLKNFGYKSQK
ncbi:MAG TPA: GTPase Era [Candidatus Gastranaerophilaceae bacterium]|nr:GTPase Era [Candidatus Gastranaerophilaceae bacterium]HPT41201.1 GTPase Era [Candidatus Gastranaerophilaceae bacterium]